MDFDFFLLFLGRVGGHVGGAGCPLKTMVGETLRCSVLFCSFSWLQLFYAFFYTSTRELQQPNTQIKDELKCTGSPSLLSNQTRLNVLKQALKTLKSSGSAVISSTSWNWSNLNRTYMVLSGLLTSVLPYLMR